MADDFSPGDPDDVIHKFNPNTAPDIEFEQGRLSHLVEGNFCRLLDLRRTPGRIESICLDSGFFRWRIADFEDAGKHWDVPIEDITRYQFVKGSILLADEKIDVLKQVISRFSFPLIITPTHQQQEIFQNEINRTSDVARHWLQKESIFFRNNLKFDFQSSKGSSDLSADLIKYLSALGFAELELKTAENYVLNPQSGEWMKGMQIAAAEAGLKEFRGSAVRTKDLFTGVGSKENRIRYLQARIGFLVAMYELMGHAEVTLYRGMATEGNWSAGKSKFFSSWTFSKNVAEAFARLESTDKSKNSYLIKRSIPTNKLFMTYVETKEMNQQYEEVEAVVIHDNLDERLW